MPKPVTTAQSLNRGIILVFLENHQPQGTKRPYLLNHPRWISRDIEVPFAISISNNLSSIKSLEFNAGRHVGHPLVVFIFGLKKFDTSTLAVAFQRFLVFFTSFKLKRWHFTRQEHGFMMKSMKQWRSTGGKDFELSAIPA